jgi:integrase
MLAYEAVLAKFALDHADLGLLDFEPPIGTERCREFLERHWGHSSPATRGRNLAVLRDFFAWAVRERGLRGDPTMPIRSPRKRGTERRAHPVDLVRRIVQAQPGRSDRIAIRLLVQLGLRKNELRQIQFRHFNLAHGELTVFGKGGTVLTVPLVWEDLRLDIERLIIEREASPDDFLLYPKQAVQRPMDSSSIHRWWAACLKRADVPHFPMHECRHTAITEFLRETGNLKLAQLLARHKDIRTTADIYGHLELSDLAKALRSMPPLLEGK